MRPFCIATMGAILGIIMGLYFKSIALFIMLIFILFLSFIIVHFIFRKYQKVICIFSIFLSIFYIYTVINENTYERIGKIYNNQEIEIEAIVVSGKNKKEYKDVYEIKIVEINNSANVQKEASSNSMLYNKKVLLNLKHNKNSSLELEYGDKISFTSTFEEPQVARNQGRI